MNRGRIQAQGDGLEKSASWATIEDVNKQFGIERTNDLENQLSAAELNVRDVALIKARNRINTSPAIGISAVMKKSYYNDFRSRHIRVDIEVNAGNAFVD